MCLTVNTIYDICRHSTTQTYPCFHERHPLVPFTRCRRRSELDAPPSICPSCAAIFFEADIDEYSASRVVGQFRRREPYSDVLTPRLSEEGIRMMDRYGAVYGRLIPRGTVWVEHGRSSDLESTRRRTRDLQYQILEPERPLPETIQPGSVFPPRSPPRARYGRPTERPLTEMIRSYSPSPPRAGSRRPEPRGRSPSPPRPRPQSRRPEQRGRSPSPPRPRPQSRRPPSRGRSPSPPRPRLQSRGSPSRGMSPSPPRPRPRSRRPPSRGGGYRAADRYSSLF